MILRCMKCSKKIEAGSVHIAFGRMGFHVREEHPEAQQSDIRIVDWGLG